MTADGRRIVNSRGGDVHFTGIAWAGGAGEAIAKSTPPTGERARMASGREASPKRPSGTAAAGFEPGFVSGACLAIPSTSSMSSAASPRTSSSTKRTSTSRCGCGSRADGWASSRGARVDHDYEFEKGPEKWRRLERNRWATLIRTYPARAARPAPPALLATELALVPVSVAGGWFTQKLASWIDVLRWLPRLRRERRGDPGRAAGSPPARSRAP